MKKSIYRYFQCMIVLGLATYLAEKLISGRLSYYINLRFAVLTLIGIVGLSVMLVIGLLPLLDEEQRFQHLDSGRKPRKQRINLVILFLMPTIFAILGLSIPLILTAYIIILIIGLTRINQFHKTNLVVCQTSIRG